MTGLAALEGRVAVIGSGIAGLVTALELAPQPVVLITRALPGEQSSSGWAQGGIAAALGADDSSGLHLADTLAAGGGLSDPVVSAGILEEAGETISALEGYGARFDRGPDGGFAMGLEAAHSRRRILHAGGDGSGAAIVRALVAAVRRCPSIMVLSGTEARRLLVHDGAVAGVLLRSGGRVETLRTGQVVMATGGIGGLYEMTTNPPGNYGQGVMMAARAGAVLSDMEFVQFHPTALAVPRHPLGLVSEAVRGEGAILVDETGARFMADVPGAELAPRAVVARAIHAVLARGGRVFLDARPALGDRFARRFPGIDALCREAGIDPARQPIPVCPAAHYHMGGIATDVTARCSLPGLWAVGECAATGLHGANRLASNSLLEAAVMARRAAQDLSGQAVRPSSVPCELPDLSPSADLAPVRAVLSDAAGIVRDGDTLGAALARLLPMVEANGPEADPATVALSIAVFAHLRNESRGAHIRADHPGTLTETGSRRMTLPEVLQAARNLTQDTIRRSA